VVARRGPSVRRQAARRPSSPPPAFRTDGPLAAAASTGHIVNNPLRTCSSAPRSPACGRKRSWPTLPAATPPLRWPDVSGLTGGRSNVAPPAAIPLRDCGTGRAAALTLRLAASNAPGLHRGSLRSSLQKRGAATLHCNEFQMPPAWPVDRYVRCYRLARWIVTFAATGLPGGPLRSQPQACPTNLAFTPARSKERKYPLAKPVALAVVDAAQAVAESARIHRPSRWHFRPVTQDFPRPSPEAYPPSATHAPAQSSRRLFVGPGANERAAAATRNPPVQLPATAPN